jgi:uncharacterized protein with NAD-binding domain and iron-sulfur cluster
MRMQPAGTRPESAPKKTRIAVLGGGCGAMAAIYGLLQSEHADEYDITVYQMGWRLGGKGASGRNARYGQRIEEHGLHIWPGLYENAFGLMRTVYDDLARPPDRPLSAWFDPTAPGRSAFLPTNFVTLMEWADERWQQWNLEVPANHELPGDGVEFPSLTDYAAMAVQMLLEIFVGADHLWELEHLLSPFAVSGWRRWLTPFVKSFEDVLRATPLWPELTAIGHWFHKDSGAALLEAALTAAEALPTDPANHTDEHYGAVLGPLHTFMAGMNDRFAHLLDEHTDIRRTYTILNYGYAILRGVVEDGILKNGFDAIDDLEFRQWLKQNGAADITLDCPFVRGWYDYVFAYEDGDVGRPCLAASVGLRTLFRSVLTYKGAFFWEMQAGMGDTIFAPMYELFRRKNVRFEFFHKVESISNLKDGVATGKVQSIRVARQLSLREGLTEYSPLVDVKALPCWPSAPVYDQIDPTQVKKLLEEDINLESYWTSWQPVEVRELTLGRDFDLVILGISLGALPYIAQDLAVHHEPFRLMLEKLKTVQTQSMQIWLTDTARELGFDHPPTIGSAYAQPMNTWADMTHLLPREDWDELAHPPKSLMYMCGTLEDAPVIPPFSDTTFPAKEAARVREASVSWLGSNVGPIWPLGTLRGSPELDWRLLVTPYGDPPGEKRFGQQYWRANIDPSERYVLSLPGTARYRLRADQSGYENLYLAGDWLKTGINAGSVEAAVMGGLQASQAISGYPRVIIGDSDRLFDPGTEDA